MHVVLFINMLEVEIVSRTKVQNFAFVSARVGMSK